MRAFGRAGLRSLCLGACLLSVLQVGSAAEQAADDPDLHNLLALLETETELATKTGMNANFIPGIATVLNGDELLARGARTVWESLSLVPGITQGLEMTGERQILSRGVGFGYASGNVKILLDGVSMNSTLLATANAVLNIPIEQIERIEVIRGPGSSVHGEYAYAGVVNIITRKQERTLHLQSNDGADTGGGGVWNWHDPKRKLRFSMNLAGLEGDGNHVKVAEDALFSTGEPELSNAPGRSNEASRYKGVFADLQWRDTFASVKLLEDDYGDHFGINHFLPPQDHNLASRNRYLTAEVGQNLRFSESLDARVRLEALQHERDRNDLYVFPASYLADQPIYMDQDYRETRTLGAADIHWRPASRHELLFGLEASQVEVDQASWDWSGLPFEIPATWLDLDRERQILSAIAQDQFRVSERVTLTGTLRYDDYSDVGAFLSPRLAAVWRVDPENVLKFQYARAFRPPTFYELEYAAQSSLDASEIATYELGYILTKSQWEGHLTLFHSDLTQPIAFDEVEDDGYVNNPDTRLRGIELEYVHRLGSRLKLDANLSYVDATRPATDQALPGGASLLGNLALLWKPRDRWTAALQLRYVGERERQELTMREPIDPYTQLDFTLNYRTPVKGVFASLGIKNLTDADIRYPDQLTSFGGVDLPYADGYPRPGRRWWLSVGYAF
ncbi:TonB-dependent receptor [uncultured Thiocystis sp.]|jgi:iron complex outermembrane receptor protein|uniref:TonB-dependent receptor plug domain-containing protein n=1 Tax=uncultured Thiocystis sp. TaxID=1202134 RepID=UPI0025FFEAC4|nr:TonB-dependent receptor [uncultured Thiocystis sp.]